MGHVFVHKTQIFKGNCVKVNSCIHSVQCVTIQQGRTKKRKNKNKNIYTIRPLVAIKR